MKTIPSKKCIKCQERPVRDGMPDLFYCEECIKPMNQPNEGMRERFDKKVRLLKNCEIVIFDTENVWGESSVTEFGYRFQRGNEIFIVPDFGRIFEHMQSEIDFALAKQRSDIVDMLLVFPKGYNKTIDDIISTITKDTKD